MQSQFDLLGAFVLTIAACFVCSLAVFRAVETARSERLAIARIWARIAGGGNYFEFNVERRIGSPPLAYLARQIRPSGQRRPTRTHIFEATRRITRTAVHVKLVLCLR